MDPADRFRSQRQLFVDGRESLSHGDTDAAAATIADLNGYPLQSYFEYLVLRARVQSATSALAELSSVQSFAQKYDDRRSYRRLLGVMKNRLAEKGDWPGYQKVSAIADAPQHPCDDLYARVVTGALNTFDRVAGTLWHSIGKHTKRCDEAFELLIERAGDVPTGALWKRTVALLQRGSVDQVEALLRFYSSRDRRVVQTWIDNLDDPQALLELEAVNGNMIHHPSFASRLLRRWMADDLPAATAFWKDNGAAFGYQQQALDDIIAGHAVLAAKRSIPQATALLNAAGTGNAQVRYWRVRHALKSRQWEEVLQRLQELTEQEQLETHWLYWRARALEATGGADEAASLYSALAGRFEFYGFLAADRIAEGYRVLTEEPVVSEASINALAKDTQIAKAIEFFLADVGWEGRHFWNSALKNLPDTERTTAAELALRIGWFDRSYASNNSRAAKNASKYRYASPHQVLVESLVSERMVNPSLVYAVMKRESAYIPDVKSPAGAIGLMQLMPATAKEMAQKTSLGSSPWSLINGEVNIRLGIEYLDEMLRRYGGNVAYAAAAYNAGPTRVKRWREAGDLPMDIWIETIPFDETRRYVKSILFNTAVFDVVRGRSQERLLSMMDAS